jgi:sarcosine oxidase
MLFFCRQSSVDVRARQDVGDAVNRKSGVAPAKHLRKNRPTPRCFCRPIEQSVMTVRRAPTIVVIGAGILGATLGHRLSVDGWDVTIIDQHPVGSSFAASASESRLIRFSQGANRADTLAAWESRSLWRQIEAETGAELLAEVGMTWFAGDNDEWEMASRAVLEACGVPVERIPVADARSLFPDVYVDDLRYLLHEPKAGLLYARRALLSLIADAVRRGAQFCGEKAMPVDSGVQLESGRRFPDHVVWACGGWAAQTFPDLLRASIVQQDTYFFAAPADWTTPPVPAWGDRSVRITGAGHLGGCGVKVGLMNPGPSVDLDRPRGSDPRLLARARAYLGKRFPSLSAAPVVRVEVSYTAFVETAHDVEPVTIAGGVPIIRHPHHASVWILGDGSGSVFKTAPFVALAMANLLRDA